MNRTKKDFVDILEQQIELVKDKMKDQNTI